MAVVQRRVGLIFGLFFLLLVVAAGRTVYLGVLRGGALRKAASNEQLSYETVTAPRGTITDRNGVGLAISEPAQDISADPYLVKAPLEAAQRLAPLLGESAVEPVDETLGTPRLRLPGARAAGARGAGGARVEDRGRHGHAGDAPRVPARDARGAGAGRGRRRRRGSGGPGVLGATVALGPRGRAARRQRRDRPAGVDQRTAPGGAGQVADADAGYEHPAARGRRAGGDRAGVRAERRDRDRDGSAQRRDPRAGELAAGGRQRSVGVLAGSDGERDGGPGGRASTTNRARRSRR